MNKSTEFMLCEEQMAENDDEFRNRCAQRLGRIIRYQRTLRNMSQIMLSEAANLNHSYYCGLENGKGNMTVKKFMDICEGLHIPPEKIIHDLYYYDESDRRYFDRKKKN